MVAIVRFRFVLDGAKYSRHKAAFKAILSEHRLAWKGGRTEFEWVGPKDHVRAEFERDAARDVTVRATLTWEGKAKTPFLNELKTWSFALGGTAIEEKIPRPTGSAADERVERELGFWDRVHRPDVDALRAQGRPADWIERDVEAWKVARAAREKELRQGQ